MRKIMISALGSGQGKTMITCGMLRAFRRRGLAVEGLKCGPDYIDPMFLTQAAGIPARNLDLFLQGEEGILHTIRRAMNDAHAGTTMSAVRGEVVLPVGSGHAIPRRCTQLAILEGAMGYYDGLAGTDEASAWHVAQVTGTPVILVVKPKGQSLTLAALINGMRSFRQPSHIEGILLNECSSKLLAHLRPILERECSLPVLGAIPPMQEAQIGSRHLGLLTAEEITDLDQRIDCIAAALEEHVDLDHLLQLAEEETRNTRYLYGQRKGRRDKGKKEDSISAGEKENPDCRAGKGEEVFNNMKAKGKDGQQRCRIAVARDEAFSFYYRDSLDALEEAGARLLFFSPLHDDRLPCCDGLYLGGGYPELYTQQLAANKSMQRSIRDAIAGGMPTIAECGGFMYLQKEFRIGEDDSPGEIRVFPMAGVLNGSVCDGKRLQRFGYLHLSAQRDTLLFKAGEQIPAHEFHHWDSSKNGGDLLAQKADGQKWRCGFVSDTLYAGFPHLHLAGEYPLAQRFVSRVAQYADRADQTVT